MRFSYKLLYDPVEARSGEIAGFNPYQKYPRIQSFQRKLEGAAGLLPVDLVRAAILTRLDDSSRSIIDYT